ncbi:unnamed protein product [Natator depressus]
MARNTLSSRFRRLDIDEYDENKFVEEPDEAAAAAEPDPAPEVEALLRQYPSGSPGPGPAGGESRAGRAHRPQGRVLGAGRAAVVPGGGSSAGAAAAALAGGVHTGAARALRRAAGGWRAPVSAERGQESGLAAAAPAPLLPARAGALQPGSVPCRGGPGEPLRGCREQAGGGVGRQIQWRIFTEVVSAILAKETVNLCRA